MLKAQRAKNRSLFYTAPKLKHVNQAQYIIGDFFEQLTANMFGLTRVDFDPSEKLIPDLTNDTQSYFMECKAGSVLDGVSIRKKQIDNFIDLVELHFPSIFDNNPSFEVNVDFAFWFYKLPKFRPQYPESLQRRLSCCDKTLVLLDLALVRNLLCVQTMNKVRRVSLSKLDRYSGALRYSNSLNVYEFNVPAFTYLDYR